MVVTIGRGRVDLASVQHGPLVEFLTLGIRNQHRSFDQRADRCEPRVAAGEVIIP